MKISDRAFQAFHYFARLFVLIMAWPAALYFMIHKSSRIDTEVAIVFAATIMTIIYTSLGYALCGPH